MSAIRCVLADDHPAILDGLTRCLEAQGISVVAAATTSDEAEAAILQHEPDVALVDVSMPGRGGLDVLRRVARRASRTPVVVYTATLNPAVAREALDAGARGFVTKDTPLEDIARALRTVCAGGMYVDPGIGFALLRTEEEGPKLTARELNILRLMSNGLRYAEIGRQLFISDETVRSHVQAAGKKMGTRSRTETVVVALRQSLIA